MLPDPNMALWPGLKQFTGLDYAEKTFNKITNFIMPYVEEHKKTFDDNFHRDFMDLMLSEIQKTTDPSSSFYGKTGEYAMINDFIDLFLAGAETTSSSLLWSILYLLHFPGMEILKKYIAKAWTKRRKLRKPRKLRKLHYFD